MVAALPQSHRVLEDIRQHIDATGVQGTAIEVYLARSILITICAEIESSILRLIDDKLSTAADLEVGAFGRSFGSVLRSAKTGEIADVMKRFGMACADRYNQALLASIGEAGRGRVGNLVRARDLFNHVAPPQFTFRDAERGYKDAVALVTAVELALGVTL